MARASDILAAARGELGGKESPPGSNRTKYGRWYGLDGQPWCMMFVQWVFAQAGASGLLPACTASCGELMRAAQAAGRWVSSGYRPGDVVIYDWGGDRAADHCGIVERADGGGVVAIAGKTAVVNDSDGGEVLRRTRADKYILGAVRPGYDEETEDSDMLDVEALTEEQLLRLASRMQTALAKRPIGSALAAELEEAKALGITDGSSPYAFCTRAQAAVMAKRAGK